MTVKTRVAPSPTGFVHLGFLRTALYDYLHARKNGGIFMLRIEDTDQGRFVEGSIEAIIKMFEKTGMIPDEGPAPYKDLGNGPYIQSQRLEIYKRYMDKLVSEGKAYYCFCTQERLSELRKQQEELKLPTKYDEHCRNLTPGEVKSKIESGEKYVVRLKIPKGEKLIFNDLVRGKIEFNTSEIEDTILLKSDGYPTYHGAVIIDDYEMKITHVFRGEEWLPSMPKQILTARALGIDLPEYAHLPSVLGADKKKLSKRTGDVAVENYFRKGYLVDALINYLAFLGWNPKTIEEIFTIDELIEKFDIKDVHKAGAIFDLEKLNWMNAQYIIRKPLDELHEIFIVWMKEYDPEFYEDTYSKFDEAYNKTILNELKTRLKRFDEYKEITTFFYQDAKLNKDLLINEKMQLPDLEAAKKSLELGLEILGKCESADLESLKAVFLDEIKNRGMKNGQVLWPIRVALSGEQFSPGAFELISILGLEKSRERIVNLLETI